MDMPSALMAEWPRGHFVVFCFLFCLFLCFKTGSHVTKVGFELACYVVKDDELSVLLSLCLKY